MSKSGEAPRSPTLAERARRAADREGRAAEDTRAGAEVIRW